MAPNEYRADLGLLPYGLVIARLVGKTLICSASCLSLTGFIERPLLAATSTDRRNTLS
jgi:hypothetical protein